MFIRRSWWTWRNQQPGTCLLSLQSTGSFLILSGIQVLGLSVCEAMMTGIPIVGLATTEMSVTIKNDYSGYVHTDVEYLIEKMKYLLDNPEKAKELGKGAQQTANERFNIERFKQDWIETFAIMFKRDKPDEWL